VRRFAVFLLILCVFWLPSACAAGRGPRWRTVWRVSQALLAGANAADVATSWGKGEANPMVRTGQRFSYGSAAIKIGAVAGGLAVEHYMVRKSPAYARYLTVANLAAATALGVVAVHNAGMPPPSP
jgi:hypothetical protein